MNVLVACEESQEVCKAFRENGHRAFSCDIQMCSGGHPEWHIQGDVLPLLNGNCTFQTADTHTHTGREVGFNHRASSVYVYKQRGSPVFVSRWARSIKRRKIEERNRGDPFLSAVPLGRLRQNSDREPGSDKSILPATIYANYSAVDVWASSSKENVPVAQRASTAHGD